MRRIAEPRCRRVRDPDLRRVGGEVRCSGGLLGKRTGLGARGRAYSGSPTAEGSVAAEMAAAGAAAATAGSSCHDRFGFRRIALYLRRVCVVW